MKDNLKSLKNRWLTFLKIIGDPWVVVLLICVLSLVVSSSLFTISETTKNILVVIISVVSSLLGGIFAKRWSDLNEENLLIARGNSAIRNLKLLLLNIGQIEKRITIYISRLKKESCDYELTKTYLEEIIEKCNILEEESINSIENWTDIIPEANLKTQIGIVSEMKCEIDRLTQQISELNGELKITQESGKQEKSNLVQELSSKEKELKDFKRKLWEKENELNTSVLSGLTWNTGINIGKVPSLSHICSTCGKFYLPYPGEDLFKPKCPDCKDK